jgi:hypothetical protein
MQDPNKSQSSAEKRRIDEKLDNALEESFPGSDPVSISQPAPDEKPQNRSPPVPEATIGRRRVRSLSTN